MTDTFQGALPVNESGGKLTSIRGELLSFTADPFVHAPEQCYLHESDGLLVIQDGIILAAGAYDQLAPRYPALEAIEHYRDALIMPGFIDCHTHYVQTPMIASFGHSLLEWLENFTFPTEARFKDKAFAEAIAQVFFRQLLEQGTTTANVFSTTFAESVHAFFEESERYNTRMISGKVLQDRHVPDNLRDTSAESSVALSESLLHTWHKRGRQLYAVIPRFAPTSTPQQMQLAGELYQRYRTQGVYLHSHLNECADEIAWVAQLYPNSRNYTEVYQRYGMLDTHTVMAHTCLMQEEEWQAMFDAGAGCVHCPASNFFLGDGQFKLWEAKAHSRPLKVGIGTDVGGGTSFSVVRQLHEAHKMAMLKEHPVSSLRSFYLATRGGAEVLGLEQLIGSLAPGYEADVTVLDFKATAFMEWRMQFTQNIFERLFVLQSLSPDHMVKATYVAGKKVFDRARKDQAFQYACML